MKLVKDVMIRDIVALAPDTSIEAAGRLLALHSISAAPVVDAEGRALGVVSLSDIASPNSPRSSAQGKHFYYRIWRGQIHAEGIVCYEPSTQHGVASDVMSVPLVTIDADAGVDEAARRLLVSHIHRLFVVEDGRVTGVISALDCLRTLVGGESAAESPQELP
jgi:CBS domain-containing protein